MPDDIVVELKVAVISKSEQRWVAHRRELAAEGDLRISHIERIGSHALKSGLRGEVAAGIGTALPPGDTQEPEPEFVQRVGTKHVGPTGHPIDSVRTQIAAKTGQQALLQYARSEWICFPCIEQRSPQIRGVA